MPLIRRGFWSRDPHPGVRQRRTSLLQRDSVMVNQRLTGGARRRRDNSRPRAGALAKRHNGLGMLDLGMLDLGILDLGMLRRRMQG